MVSRNFILSCIALLIALLPLSLGQSSVSNPFPMPLCYGYVIEEASIDTLQGYMSEGNLTSVQLTMCYLQRIAQLNPYLQ
jgi:amidase